jgi:hypothetical protein
MDKDHPMLKVMELIGKRGVNEIPDIKPMDGLKQITAQEILKEAADKWVFETNGHKWSNNDNTAGDNYGSFIAGAKWQQERIEKLGLKIEERELSLEERKRIYEMEYTNDIEVENNHWLESKLKTRNIPTKLITITYKDEKIETYE